MKTLRFLVSASLCTNWFQGTLSYQLLTFQPCLSYNSLFLSWQLYKCVLHPPTQCCNSLKQNHLSHLNHVSRSHSQRGIVIGVLVCKLIVVRALRRVHVPFLHPIIMEAACLPLIKHALCGTMCYLCGTYSLKMNY